MIGFLRTRVRKQPIIVLYFESETVLKYYNLEACVCLMFFFHNRRKQTDTLIPCCRMTYIKSGFLRELYFRE